MKKIKYLMVLLISIILITGCNKNKTENEKKDKPKEDTKIEKKVVKKDNFEINIVNTTFTLENSTYQVRVKNISQSESYINEFIIHVKNEMQEDVAIVYGVINETIEANGERIIDCSYGDNLEMYPTIEFEVLN